MNKFDQYNIFVVIEHNVFQNIKHEKQVNPHKELMSHSTQNLKILSL